MQSEGTQDASTIMDALSAALSGTSVPIREEQSKLCGVGRGVLWHVQVRQHGSGQCLGVRLENVARMARLLGYRLVLERNDALS